MITLWKPSKISWKLVKKWLEKHRGWMTNFRPFGHILGGEDDVVLCCIIPTTCRCMKSMCQDRGHNLVRGWQVRLHFDEIEILENFLVFFENKNIFIISFVIFWKSKWNYFSLVLLGNFGKFCVKFSGKRIISCKYFLIN